MMTMLAIAVLQDCCARAHDVQAESRDGRYRVEAKAQTELHGPYLLRFRCLARAGGAWEEQGCFELFYDTHACCELSMHVSPSGNGFLLLFAGGAAFHGTDGTEWGKWSSLGLDSREQADEHGALRLADGRRFFLPLGTFVSETLTEELRCLRHGEVTAEARGHVARLSDDDPEVRESALLALARLGVRAVPALRAAPAEASAEAGAVLDRVPRWGWLVARGARLDDAISRYDRVTR